MKKQTSQRGTVSTPVAAVLDACVLFSAALRDTLLRAAVKRLYRLYLTEEILDEVRRNLLKRGRIIDPQLADRLVDQIRRAFPGSMVEGYSAVVQEMTNHPKDRHVLAAAVWAGATVIVTHNLADFPKEALDPHGVVAQSPDDFLGSLYAASPEMMVRILQEQSAALRSPHVSVEDILDRLAQQVPGFAALVREYTHASGG